MTTLKDLKSIVWSTMNILRSKGVSSQNDIGCISRLLLLKRLSDVFEEETEAVEKATWDKTLAWNSPKDHRFFIPEEARWDRLRRLNHHIGEKLNQVVAALENFNPKLKGVFSSFDFCSKSLAEAPQKRDNLLSSIILELSSCSLRNKDLENLDVLGQVYDSLIEMVATRELQASGVFATPENLMKLMVTLLKPQPNVNICDPTCGSGSFLVKCARQIKHYGGDLSKVWFYGQEINPVICVLAQINMLMHDIPNFDIRQGDTIREPQFVKDGELMRFDIVVTNPPFSIKGNWGHEMAMVDSYHRFRYGIPPKGAADFAFIQHVLATLNNTGRAAMLVPNGVLFRSGSEGEIRERVLKADLVEAVIGLPSNLHYITAIPLAILILNQNKPKERRDRVLIVDATRYSHTEQKRNYLADQDITRIESAYTTFANQEGFSKVVSLKELADNGYILNVNRYVLLPKVNINTEAEVAKLQILKAQLEEFETNVNNCLKELGIEI